MMARCEGNDIEVLERVFPAALSLGSFYTMICEFIGYNKYGDEGGKVMGLAPYGKDTYCEQISPNHSSKKWSGFEPRSRLLHAVRVATKGWRFLPDGTVRLARHFSDRMTKLFGAPREPHAEITQRDMDLAYAMQHCFEEICFHLFNRLHQRVPMGNLVMAGGCALNSVVNGKIFDKTPFRQTWIQPAAGDEGLAIGACLCILITPYSSSPGDTR